MPALRPTSGSSKSRRLSTLPFTRGGYRTTYAKGWQMSCDAQDSQSPPRTKFQQGIDWVGKHWPRIRLGHEGMMLDKITRQNRCVEVLARNAMTGEMDNAEGWPGQEGDDDMGVSIGDTIVNHNYPQPSEPNVPAPSKSLAAKALPWLLGAAIPASGAMGALATYLANRPAAMAPAGDAADWDVEVSKVGAEQ